MKKLGEISQKVASSFEAMRLAVEQAGPMPEKYRELCLLAGAVGARNQAQVRNCMRHCLAKGIDPVEIRQAILVLLGLVQGLSPLVDTLGWLDDEIQQHTASGAH